MTPNKPSWSPRQRARLAALLDAQATDPAGTWVGYYCTDQWGRPANGGATDERVRAGLVQRMDPPLTLCARGYHATREPHQWRGCRVWVVALLGARRETEDKAAALVREIVGEVMPTDVIDPRIAARMGVRLENLGGADLGGADLRGADLRGADLRGAYLGGAYLGGAYLGGADLRGAYLGGADLRDAYLRGADLRGADLHGANLGGADLGGANLGGADLARADLHGANLHGANLGGADLALAYLALAYLGGANLRGANLGGADLRGAYLRGAIGYTP